MSDDMATAYGKLTLEHQQLIDALKRWNPWGFPSHRDSCDWRWGDRSRPCTCGAAELTRIAWGVES